jgi:hypothetical protein
MSTSSGVVFSPGGDNFQLQLHFELGLLFAFWSSVATAAASDTATAKSFAFSLRFTSEAVVEGEAEVATEDDTNVGRERQTSLNSLSSKSLHKGMILSRSSDQTTNTRSSRWEVIF